MNLRLEVTIVTAFYDIDREKLDDFKRTTDEYLSYFDFWAGLKNKLIVYTTEDMKEKILNIRRKHRLESETVVLVKDLEYFDKNALELMQDTFKLYEQSINRKYPDNIECKSALYCYLMYLKPFFVCDAIKSSLCDEDIIWLDFGFNHGGKIFTNKAQFNFKLQKEANFQKDKVSFFSVRQKDENTLAYIYFNMENFLMGGLIYASSKQWEIFKDDMKQALKIFVSFGMVDDDQPMFLWLLRNYPDKYTYIGTFKYYFESLYTLIPKENAKNLDVAIIKEKYYKILKKEAKQKLKQGQYLAFLLNFLRYVFYKLLVRKTVDIDVRKNLV